MRHWLASAGFALIRSDTFDRLIASEIELKRFQRFLEFSKHIRPDHLPRALALLPQSKSEYFQDIFCALLRSDAEEGFFVEFGATDGVSGSNTWLFEKHLHWHGILAEPAKVWHEKLSANRSCMVFRECIWSESGAEVQFLETLDAGLSTVEGLASSDRHSGRRTTGRRYRVKTLTLADMLEKAGAPNEINVMTIDTEGSEFDILKVFPFEDWRIDLLCIEHNFRDDRDKVRDLLVRNGFKHALSACSAVDDWYVAEKLTGRVDEIFVSPWN